MHVIPEMGLVAKEMLDTYMGDLIHDGILLEMYGRDKNYLWCVRETGTHLICLDGMENDKHGPTVAREFIGNNKRFFLIRPYNLDKEPTGEGKYMQEVSREHALELVEHLSTYGS